MIIIKVVKYHRHPTALCILISFRRCRVAQREATPCYTSSTHRNLLINSYLCTFVCLILFIKKAIAAPNKQSKACLMVGKQALGFKKHIVAIGYTCSYKLYA